MKPSSSVSKRSARPWLARLLASERGPWIGYGLGLLLALPALGVGLVNDDFVHRVGLEGAFEFYRPSPLRLYEFAGGTMEVEALKDQGSLAWWSSPELVLRFFRPLSGALLWVDHAAFGRAALPAHVHSLMWFALLGVFSTALLRRLVRPTAASVAALLYGFAGAHAMTISWLAARHALVGAAFGVMFLWAHVSFRQGARRWRAWMAPAALVVGLLSSETALGAIVFVLLYELVAEAGPKRARLLAALPALSIGVAYLGFYVSQGYGVHHSGAYISPLTDPTRFGLAAMTRMPILLGDLYGAAPSILWGLGDVFETPLLVYGLVATAAVVALLVRARSHFRVPERRRLVWLFLSSVLSLVPVVGGMIGGRLLPIALIGSSAVLSATLVQTWLSGKGWLRVAVVLLCVLHIGWAALLRIGFPAALDQNGIGQREMALNADLAACPDGARLLVVNASDPSISLYLGSTLGLYRPDEARRLSRITVLSVAPHGHVVSTIDDHTIEVSMTTDARIATRFELVYSDETLAPGDVVAIEGMRVDILEAHDGLWTRARFTFDEPLAQSCVARWDGERLIAEAAPPPSEPRVVPFAAGPMGM